MSNTKITSHVIESGAVESTHIASGAITASHVTGITTANITENTNLYYTDTRARASISVTGGNLSYDNLTGVLQLTDAEIRDALSATSSGDGSLIYTAGTGVIAYTGPSASEVQAHLSAGTGVTYSGGQISIGQAVGTGDTVSFGNITTTGYLRGPANFTIDPAAYGDDTGTLIIAGNLQVDGTTTTINSTTLTVDDLNLTLASGAANAAAANGAGITVDGASATLLYQASGDKFVFNKGLDAGPITSSGSVIASGNSNSFGNTTITNLNATTVTTSGSVIASGNSNSFGNTTVGTLSSGAITSTGLVLNGGRTAEGVTAAGTYAELTRASGGDLGLLFNKDTSKWLIGIDNSDGNAANLRFMYGAYNASIHPGFGSDYSGLNLTYQGRVGVGTRYPGAELEVAGTALVENAKLKAIAESNTDTAVDVFIYDTRKDSDGGAWRKRTQHASWYNETLNTSTRGARKEFPSVAVIVAETSQVTIYDGDDPDMPMWMIINTQTGATSVIHATNSISVPTALSHTSGLSSVTTLNGQIILGSANWFLFNLNFVKDDISTHVQYGNFSAGRAVYSNPLSGRNSSGIYSRVSTNGIITNSINDVAMTVLPNAPIDADTGLPVPTIAVATGGGVSVIKDDGTVVDITSANGWMNSGYLTFDQDNYIVAQVGNATGQGLMFRYPIPSSDITVSSGDSNLLGGGNIYNASFSPSFGNELGGLSKIAHDESGIAVDAKNNGTQTLVKYWKNDNDYSDSSVAYITSDYNTGWMHGDIKLATLSDTDTTNAVGVEILTNTDFTSGTSPWVAVQATISAGSNKLTITPNSGVNGGVYHAITTVVGKTYVYQLKVLADASNFARMFAGTSNDITSANKNDLASKFTLGNGTHSITFVATGTTTYIWIEVGGGTQQATEFDDATVRLAEEDRSVNNNGLQVFGTVTKTAVATGAELVAYSGFSSSNYLMQPYNSDLDFTGDFCWNLWYYHVAVSQGEYIAFRAPIGNGTPKTEIFVNTDNTLGIYVNDLGAIYTPATSVNTWHHLVAVRSSGILRLYLNGKEVASGASTVDLTNTSAILALGLRTTGGYNGINGKLALFRVSATAPSAEQIAKIYNDEKHLFQENAKATLYGSSDAVTALAYDDDTELLHVGTSAGRSVFQGLNRVDNTTDAVGAAISASNGLVAED